MRNREEQKIKSAQTRLELIHGDIIEAEVDAIVNPTDLVLSGGGTLAGLDRQIHSAGGEEIDRECEEIVRNKGICLPGEAVLTTGGRLQAKYVIHTIGPVWQGGKHHEAEVLTRCYENSLNLARKNKIQSIAFPAISTGKHGYPIEEAALVALTAVKEFVEQAQHDGEMSPSCIQFVLFNEESYDSYVNAFSRLGHGTLCLIGSSKLVSYL